MRIDLQITDTPVAVEAVGKRRDKGNHHVADTDGIVAVGDQLFQCRGQVAFNRTVMLIENRIDQVLLAAEVIVQGGGVFLAGGFVDFVEGNPVDTALGKQFFRRSQDLLATLGGTVGRRVIG